MQNKNRTEYQSEVLCYLIQNNILAPNSSRLAKELGRSDKKLLYKLLRNGKAGERAIQDLWDDIRSEYYLSDYALALLPEIWEMSNQLAEQLKLCDFKDLYEHRWECIKDTDLQEKLQQLYNNSILNYNYVVALFYAKIQHFNPNKTKNSSILIEVIQQVDAILYQQYPEAIAVHRIANDLITFCNNVKMIGWCHLMVQIGQIIGYYTDPTLLDQATNALFCEKMPFGDSWWAEDNANTDETKIWYLMQCENEMSLYNVLEIHAKRGESIRKEDCIYQSWGFIANTSMLQCGESRKNKAHKLSYFNIMNEITDDTDCLHLQLNKDYSAKPYLSLPPVLKRLSKDDVWNKWAEEQEHKVSHIFADLMVQSAGFERTDYKVADISLCRKSCTLIIKDSNKKIYRAHFDVEKYQHLKNISIWEKVLIFRNKTDDALYAYWTDSVICIKLPNNWKDCWDIE